jgi:DNA-3-methyladenine glycosylase II
MRQAVADVLEADPEMAALIDRFGPVTIEPADHEFQRFAVSILNQSISTAAANSIREDLFATIDQPVTPEDLLQYDADALADIVGAQKAEYLHNAARAYGDDLSAEALSAYSDRDVVDRISEIRGCGEWTGNMYLVFVLGREDVFPIGDLAVRRGIEHIYGEMSREEMVEKARDWEPYRSYATEYIWAKYESG